MRSHPSAVGENLPRKIGVRLFCWQNLCVIALVILAVWTERITARKIDNGIDISADGRNAPRIACYRNGMKFIVFTKKNFTGVLYVKGMAGNPQCNRNYTGQTTAPSLNVAYEDCIHQRERMTGQAGMMYSMELVVQFHPFFTTSADRAFVVTCSYREQGNTVTNNQILQGNVENEGGPGSGPDSAIPLSKITFAPSMPRCSYTIHKEEPTGPEISYAKVGETTYHKWQCAPGEDGEFHGLLVHTCFARSGSIQVPLLDRRGCSVDTFAMGTPTYTLNLTMAYVEVHAFKFADNLQISFSCSIALCLRMNNRCAGITPPSCEDPEAEITTLGPGVTDIGGTEYPTDPGTRPTGPGVRPRPGTGETGDGYQPPQPGPTRPGQGGFQPRPQPTGQPGYRDQAQGQETARHKSFPGTDEEYLPEEGTYGTDEEFTTTTVPGYPGIIPDSPAFREPPVSTANRFQGPSNNQRGNSGPGNYPTGPRPIPPRGQEGTQYGNNRGNQGYQAQPPPRRNFQRTVIDPPARTQGGVGSYPYPAGPQGQQGPRVPGQFGRGPARNIPGQPGRTAAQYQANRNVRYPQRNSRVASNQRSNPGINDGVIEPPSFPSRQNGPASGPFPPPQARGTNNYISPFRPQNIRRSPVKRVNDGNNNSEIENGKAVYYPPGYNGPRVEIRRDVDNRNILDSSLFETFLSPNADSKTKKVHKTDTVQRIVRTTTVQTLTAPPRAKEVKITRSRYRDLEQQIAAEGFEGDFPIIQLSTGFNEGGQQIVSRKDLPPIPDEEIDFLRQLQRDALERGSPPPRLVYGHERRLVLGGTKHPTGEEIEEMTDASLDVASANLLVFDKESDVPVEALQDSHNVTFGVKEVMDGRQVCMSEAIMIQVSVLVLLIVSISIGVAIFFHVRARRKSVRTVDLPPIMWRYDTPKDSASDSTSRTLQRGLTRTNS